MPFTPAHTAIVLPFLKSKRVSATGLVIGSMTPDFEYFLKMDVDGRVSHSLAGLFYFDLPVAVMLALIFHRIVKGNLIDNLPTFLQKRLLPVRHFDFVSYLKRHYVPFGLSVLMGALSHIGWDAFTHNSGYFVSKLAFLYQNNYVRFDGVNYPLWYALQHVSTGIGLTAVFIYIMRLPRHPQSTSKPELTYWIGVTMITVLAFSLRFNFNFDFRHVGLPLIVITLISSFCLAVILLGLRSRKKQMVGHG